MSKPTQGCLARSRRWSGLLALCASFLGLLCLVSAAAAAVWSEGAPADASRPAQVSVSGPATGPVPVPEATAQAWSRFRSGFGLYVVSTLWNLALPAAFLFSGVSARLRSWALGRARRWYLAFALYGLAAALGLYLLDLPVAFCAGYLHPHHYGLSNQSLGKWLGNSLKGEAIQLVMLLAIGWVPFQLAARSPRRWWLWLGLLALPFVCLMCLVQPVVIDPLFNHFQSMKDQALERKILDLAARAGIEGSRVYEVDKSVDTKTVNAYVNGFMGTKRIVIWDTAIQALDEDELLFIMGHEMGHYVLHHVARGIVFSCVLVVGALLLLHRLAGWAIGRFQRRFGFQALSDLAAAPLGLLLVQLIVFAGLPLAMAFSRYQEHEADRFGLELTRNNHAAAMSFTKLQQHNLSLPRPPLFNRIWFGSHPCLADRIQFCNEYRPWEQGESLRYEGYFRQPNR